MKKQRRYGNDKLIVLSSMQIVTTFLTNFTIILLNLQDRNPCVVNGTVGSQYLGSDRVKTGI